MGALLSLFRGAQDTTTQSIADLENRINNTSDPEELEQLKQQLAAERQRLDEISAAQRAIAQQTADPNSGLNITQSEINGTNSKLQDVIKRRDELKLKIESIAKTLEELLASKKPIEDQLVLLAAERIANQNALAEVRGQKQYTKEELEIGKLDTRERELMEKDAEISIKITKLNDELVEIENKIAAMTLEKNKLVEEDATLGAQEKSLSEELLNLESKKETVSESEKELRANLEKRIADLEKEGALKEEEAARLCLEAIEELNTIERSLDITNDTNGFQTLLNKMLNHKCSSDEYNMMSYSLKQTITSIQASICEEEIALLTPIAVEIPKVKTIPEIDKIAERIAQANRCSSELKISTVLKLTEAVAARRAFILMVAKNEQDLEIYYNKFTTETLTVAQINEIFFKVVEMNENDSPKIKEYKLKLTDEYIKLITAEIEKTVDICLKIDITPIDDPTKSVQQLVEINVKKLRDAYNQSKDHIRTIEEIYSSLPEGYKLKLEKTNALKPINEFIQQLNEMTAAYSDDTAIYNAKLLFGFITCGHGVITGSSSMETNNPINTYLRTFTSHTSYKANLMFGELQPIIYPLEMSNGPVHQKGNTFNDAFLSGYLGCYKEAMLIKEGKTLTITKTNTGSGNKTIIEEYGIGEDGQTIVAIGKSEKVLHNGTNYYLTTPCGPIDLKIINNEVHTELYQVDFATELQNVKIYKIDSDLKYNIDGLWYNNDAKQTLCTDHEQIEYTKRQIGDKFYITEELDIEVYRTEDELGNTVFDYNILRKKTPISGFREKMIRYVSNLKNKIGSSGNKDYMDLKTKVEKFITTNTTTWDDFFKEARAILDSTPEYYWKLMERYTQCDKLYPKQHWYNLPSTFRVYDFQSELKMALAFLINQIFVGVSGNLLTTPDDISCFKYLNPVSQYSKDCFIKDEEDKKLFGLNNSTIKIVSDYVDSETLLTLERPQYTLYDTANYSTYGVEKEYVKHYFSDSTKMTGVFPVIPHLNTTYFNYDILDVMLNNILEHSETKGMLVKLTSSQKLFMNMYGFMDYREIAEMIYYDLIVAALQFDIVFCLNKKKTTMSICHNDAKRGCTEQQALPSLFGHPVDGKDSLFDL